MHHFLPVLFYLLYSPRCLEAIIKTGQFKSRFCSQNDIETIFQVRPSKTNNASSSMTCALLCNRYPECKYAFFNASDSTCKQVVGHNDDSTQFNTGNNEDPLYNEACTVLTKKDPEKKAMKIWNDFTFLPYAVVTKGKGYHVTFISHMTTTPQGYIITQKPNSILIAPSKSTFVSPPVHVLRIFTELSPKQCFFYHFDLLGEMTKHSTIEYSSVEVIKRDYLGDNGEVKDITTAGTVENVTTALLKGYRRVETHPSRVEIVGDDVLFDITGALAINSMEEIKYPFFVSSIKESVKLGKRYIFRYQLNKGSALPYEEEDQLSPWVMETSWEKVILNGGTIASLMRLLGIFFRQGKEIRVVIEKRIATDVLLARLSKKDVVVAMAEYLLPFDGRDVNVTEQFLRLPVASCRSRDLLFCEMSFQNATVNVISSWKFRTIEYFTSTKNWTKVFSLSFDNKVLYGNRDDVLDATIKGRSIRVCIYGGNSDKCFGAAAIYSTNSGDIIIHSPPVLKSMIRDDVLSSVDDKCRRVMYLVSTGGVVQRGSFSPGTELFSTGKAVLHDFHEWFVQFD